MNNVLTLIFGEDIPGVYLLKDQEAAKVKGEEVEQFNENVDAALVINVLQSQSLFFEKRRFEFINPAFLKSKDDSARADDLLAALNNIPEGTRVFLILEGKTDKRLKFTKDILRIAAVREARLVAKQDVVERVISLLGKHQSRLDNDARNYLRDVSETWESISEAFLVTECEKWLLMASDGVVTEEVIRLSLPTYMNQSVFQFWDYLIHKKKELALQMSVRLFDDNPEQLKNIGYVISQLRLCIAVDEATQAGMASSTIAKNMGANPYRLKHITRDLKFIKGAQARKMLLDIYQFQVFQRTKSTGSSYADLWIKYLT